jgi:hypothetical protein
LDGWTGFTPHGGSDAQCRFKGPAEAVEALCAACCRDPPQARIERIEVTEDEVSALGEEVEVMGLQEEVLKAVERALK